MSKLTLVDPSVVNQSLAPTIVANNSLLENIIEDTLSRSGVSPNAMNTVLDMNSNRILNLPDGISNQEPATVSQLAALVTNFVYNEQAVTTNYMTVNVTVDDDSDDVAEENARILSSLSVTSIIFGKTLLLPTGIIWVKDHDSDGYAWTWLSNLKIAGHGLDKTFIQIIDAANCHVCGGEDVSDLNLNNFAILGNKTNQSIGAANPWRGIYLLGACHRITARSIIVQNCVDHGCHLSDGGDLSNQVGKDSVFEYCQFLDNGSAEHSAAGGPGGTGAGMGDPSGMYFKCYASGNHLNGFKTSNGTLSHCVSEYNGGGMETGFASPSGSDAAILHCIIQYNTAGGVRHMGQGDCFRMIGNLIQGNGQSGILMGSGVARALIAHNTIRNNGQDAANVPRSSTTGLDAITIISNSTVGPTNILIDGNIMEDTQDPGSKTQEYAVYIENDSGPIKITSSNQAIGNKNQALYLNMDGDEDVTIEDFIGLSSHYKDISTTTAPADTNTNTLKTRDILANERTLGSIYEVFCSGLISGTGGTKIVRLVVGGTSFAVISEASGDQQSWSISARIRRTDSTRYWVQGTAVENGGSAIAFGGTSSVASNSALTIAVSCTKGNAADVITQEELIIKTVN